MDQDQHTTINFASITADIVSSYVANNSVHRAELPALIATVHAALHGLVAPEVPAMEKPQPAVPVRKSVTSQHLISLEDGKPYKTLKRHLAKLGLTPNDYRAKWGLPQDYPMVAAEYASRRSALAKSLGLGRLGKGTAAKAVSRDEPVSLSRTKGKPKNKAPSKRRVAS